MNGLRSLPNLRGSRPRDTGGPSETPRHIWDIIVENMKDVPPEDFAAFPKDGLSQIDHSFTAHPRETRERCFR
jgi:hypothetical protein